MIDYLMENGIKSAVFWVIGVIAFVLAFGLFNVDSGGAFPSVPNDEWQAVFLNNNQVYFGKLEDYDDNYVTLTDVYYLKTAADLENEKDGSNLNLIKLGGEVHGPKDEMFISKASILFWENMKETSRVVQSIVGSKK